MPAQVHGVVLDSNDVDRDVVDNAIEDEMAPSPSLSRNVERTQPYVNLVARVAIGKIWIVGQVGKRRDECATIDRGLSSPKFHKSPLKDSDKVALGCFRETNAPASAQRHV
jgi:hypothetical protein